MSVEYRKLTEGLPSRRAPDRMAFPTDPKRVRAWVAALPRANQAVSHRQMLDALANHAQLRLDGAQRLGALEALRPAVLEAIGLLERQSQGGALPLPPPKARAYAELVEFERALALGYVLAVAELCGPEGGVPFLRGGQVLLALARAAYHASRLISRAYFLYEVPAPGEWLRLHAIHAFARSHKLQDKPVEEPVEEQSLSVGQVYAQTLILALANPYRFSQREQAELWPVTRDLALYVSLHPQQRGSDAFAVAPDEDAGPGYIPEERVDERVGRMWLDLLGVRQLLDAPLAAGRSGATSIKLRNGRTLESTVELLRKLRAGWGSATARQAARIGAGHALETVIGLTGLHFYLAGAVDFETFVRQTGMGQQSKDRERAVWSAAGGDSARVPLTRAEVLDQSLGGYRLRWSREQNVRARVGEVLGLSFVGNEGDPRHWLLGIIRWLRHDAEGNVDAGVALLARRARAVAVRSIDGTGIQRPALRAVEFRPLHADREDQVQLVAPSVLDTVTRRIELIRGESYGELGTGEPMVEQCDQLALLENAGDFLLVQATRAAA